MWQSRQEKVVPKIKEKHASRGSIDEEVGNPTEEDIYLSAPKRYKTVKPTIVYLCLHQFIL